MGSLMPEVRHVNAGSLFGRSSRKARHGCGTGGVPQVYYVGLLAGENDMNLLAKSGIGREINRHYYTLEEIDRAVQHPVVQLLFELIRFRNQHPALNGSFSMPETPDSMITLRWDNGKDWAMLKVDFASGSYSISNSPLG